MERTMCGELDSACLKHKKYEIIGYFVRSFDEITGMHSYHYVSLNSAKFSECLNESTTNVNDASVDTEKDHLHSYDCPLMNYSQTVSKHTMHVVNAEACISSIQNELSKNQQGLNAVGHTCSMKDKQRISCSLHDLLKRVPETALTICDLPKENETITAYNLHSVPGSSCEASTHDIVPMVNETRIRFNLNDYSRSKPNATSTNGNVPENIKTQIAYCLKDASINELEKTSSEINSPMNDDKQITRLSRVPPESEHETSSNSNSPVDEEFRTTFNLNDFQRFGPETVSTKMNSTVNISHVSNKSNFISSAACESTTPNNQSSSDAEMQVSNSANVLSRSLCEAISDDSLLMEEDDQFQRNINSPLSSSQTTSPKLTLPVNMETQLSCNSSCTGNQPSEHSSLDIDKMNPFNFNINARNQLETTSTRHTVDTNVHSSPKTPENQRETTSRFALETEEQNLTKPNWFSGSQHETNSTDFLMEPEEQYLLNLDMNTKHIRGTLNETTLSDSAKVRVKFNFNFTSETEQYDRVMVYLRDTHDICCSYTSIFVDVLQDMVTVISGCESEFFRFKPLLPNSDNIQNGLYSYLQIVKVLCKNIYEDMTRTDSLMNSCLNQQRVLNKICAGMAYSTVPLSINDDAIDIINKLSCDLCSVNNYIQRNIESVNLYHTYKEEIVYIMRRIRQICHQSNF